MVQGNYLEEELTQLIMADTSTWRFIQQGSLDGVWYWDLENTDNEWMSAEFWRTFGIDPATRAHSPSEWQDIIFPDDLATAMENFEAHCADPDHPYDQVVRYRHADGSTVWIRCRGMAIRDNKGHPIRMLGAHTDLTAVKRSEESAKAGWRAARTANEELRSFAYSMSHDLKAPANTLELLLSELEAHMHHLFDREGREIFDMCTQTVARMQRLVEYVLDYTRVIGMDSRMEAVELTEAAEQAIQNLKADIRSKAAVVEVGPLPQINAIRPQVTILFQNLIGNALKFAAPDRPPRIRVFCTNDPLADHLTVSVQDNGIGIPAESQSRIFHMFQRLHGHSEIEGAGLGLPMCQHIATKHRGEITLVSQVNEGSVFTLKLPRTQLA